MLKKPYLRASEKERKLNKLRSLISCSRTNSWNQLSSAWLRIRHSFATKHGNSFSANLNLIQWHIPQTFRGGRPTFCLKLEFCTDLKRFVYFVLNLVHLD